MLHVNYLACFLKQGSFWINSTYKEPTHWKRLWCWERLIAGSEGDDKDEMVGWLSDSMDMSLSKLQEMVKGRESLCAVVYEVAKSQTQLRDWTTMILLHENSCHLIFYHQVLNILTFSCVSFHSIFLGIHSHCWYHIVYIHFYTLF